MKPVTREELVDYQTYQDQREAFRKQIFAIKRPRRIHLGDSLTFLFENRDTIRYQVQEMMRAEQLVRESEIQHELETYNEILGGPGELGCTLLIEIDDPAERDAKLRRWLDLMDHLFLVLEDGSTVALEFDHRQVGDDRLSSVQYVKFSTGGTLPVALRANHPDYQAEVVLNEAQRAALAADLSS